MSCHTNKKRLIDIIYTYLKLKTNLTEKQIRQMLKTYETILDTEGVFEDGPNENLKIFKEYGIIREFPKKSGFYIPSSPIELYQELLKEITQIVNEREITFNYVLPLEGIIIKDWKKENLERFKNVANNLIKNWREDVIICARRLSPFEPEIIVDTLREGRKIKILLVYPDSKRSLNNVMDEAKQKICEIYHVMSQEGKQNGQQTERYLKNLIIKHTNIMGDQFRFMKVGDVTILVIGSIEKTHYDAIIIENERFSKMIEEVFNTYFEKAKRISIRRLCTSSSKKEYLQKSLYRNREL